jgi:hypothetical protein
VGVSGGRVRGSRQSWTLVSRLGGYYTLFVTFLEVDDCRSVPGPCVLSDEVVESTVVDWGTELAVSDVRATAM